MEETNYNIVKKNITKAEKVKNVEDEKPKQEKIISSNVTKVDVKKKSLFERTILAIIGPNGIKSLGGYLTRDIIGPAIKNIIVDSVTSGINMLVYKDDNHVTYSKRNYGQPVNYNKQSKVSYGTAYSSTPNKGRQYYDDTPFGNKSKAYADEYLFKDRREALDVLNELRNNILKYNYVSLADYYDMIGAPSVFTDNNYGWSWLEEVPIRNVQGGFVIQLPEVELI